MQRLIGVLLLTAGTVFLNVALQDVLPRASVLPAILGILLLLAGCALEAEKLGEDVERRHHPHADDPRDAPFLAARSSDATCRPGQPFPPVDPAHPERIARIFARVVSAVDAALEDEMIDPPLRMVPATTFDLPLPAMPRTFGQDLDDARLRGYLGELRRDAESRLYRDLLRIPLTISLTAEYPSSATLRAESKARVRFGRRDA